ncbi:MAG: 3-keto-5-aminohexanoate cleavage protein [Verrucomicrobia bacterium]|nr:3-keto-5-aminohexanoate cleavage protein [Verrucomicrobiota bacterium]
MADNIWHDEARTQLATNAGMLRRVQALVAANGRTVMAPAELRERLALEPGHGRYGRKIA